MKTIFSHKWIRSARAWAGKHKIIAAVILVVVLYGGYRTYAAVFSTTAQPRYVFAAVEKGNLVSSVTGSGQVVALNQVDLKPKASGDVTYIGVQAGQVVKAGTLIASLDSRDAQKAVRDAQVNLETARLSLQKLQQPADTLSTLQAENSLASAQQSKQSAQDALAKSYDDAFTAVSNAFLDMPTVVNGVHDVLYQTSYSGTQDNISFYTDSVKDYDASVTTYRDSTNSAYTAARTAYDKAFLDYKAANHFSDVATVESLLNETYTMTKLMAEAVKSADNMLGFVKDRLSEHSKPLPSQLAAHQTSIAGYTSKVNSNLSNLFGDISSIKSAKDSIQSTDQSITEKTESFNKLKAGTDPLDLRSSQLSLLQRENSLRDAQEALSNYYMYAPFDGTIAKVSAKKGDSVSSGTAVATLITPQQTAQLSLNEVDAAKIKVGQKATITFDAINGLAISGHVAEVDTVGTVSQGVVTYTLQIVFDTQDDRVRPGMSVSAAIITNIKQDVLLVPSAAVKTQGGQSVVQMTGETLGDTATSAQGVLLTQPLQSVSVVIGDSNDTSTEVTSGLKEGDMVVARTITGTTATTRAQTPSLLNAVGGTRATGGAAAGGAFRAGATGR